jgi:hypothetical protein
VAPPPPPPSPPILLELLLGLCRNIGTFQVKYRVNIGQAKTFHRVHFSAAKTGYVQNTVDVGPYSWWNESIVNLERDLQNSTATWKIVNNHYLMSHFSLTQYAEVKRILTEGNVNVFIGGHRHGEGHSVLDGVHYIENGGGGGKNYNGGCGANELGCIWGANTFGFMAAKVNKDYLRIEFFNDSNTLLHCYSIPVDRSDTGLPISALGVWSVC